MKHDYSIIFDHQLEVHRLVEVSRNDLAADIDGDVFWKGCDWLMRRFFGKVSTSYFAASRTEWRWAGADTRPVRGRGKSIRRSPSMECNWLCPSEWCRMPSCHRNSPRLFSKIEIFNGIRGSACHRSSLTKTWGFCCPYSSISCASSRLRLALAMSPAAKYCGIHSVFRWNFKKTHGVAFA